MISLFANLGILGFFKYYNFFIDNLFNLFPFLGDNNTFNSLNIILPVGISFYTFQTLSYTIDIYKNKITPTKDFISFSAFVSFFPQLVAGPIERAKHLLPQFIIKREFEYSKSIDGLRQILWGFVKKIVIADNCAYYVNLIFDNYQDFNSSTLILGAVFFAFQIYGDFSGYSDIAIGTSRLFGFNLKKNFAFPYFSRDIAEFWRRWHISLTTWFRDYIYIPLGGSRVKLIKKIQNIFIVFLISGLWHGANWKFIVWGFINAIYFLPLLLLNKNRNHLEIVASGKIFPSLTEFFSIILTFCLTVLAWIFFRADSIFDALCYISNIFSSNIFQFPEIRPFILLVFILFFVFIEWIGREGEYAVQGIKKMKNKTIRWGIYYTLLIVVFLMNGEEQEFIYFQF